MSADLAFFIQMEMPLLTPYVHTSDEIHQPHTTAVCPLCRQDFIITWNTVLHSQVFLTQLPLSIMKACQHTCLAMAGVFALKTIDRDEKKKYGIKTEETKGKKQLHNTQSLNNKTCIILTFHVIAIDWIKDKEQRNKNNDKNKVYKIYIYI